MKKGQREKLTETNLEWVSCRHAGVRHSHSMAGIAADTGVSQELARESLMEISQSIPDKVLSSNQFSDSLPMGNRVEVKDSEEADKYRSKLISISYTESPDTKTLPVSIASPNSY